MTTSTTMTTSSTAATTTTAPRPPSTSPVPTTAAGPPKALASVKGSQAIVVHAATATSTTAALTAYERTTTGWRTAFGPWPARVGAAGIAPPGAKREGDRRTPSGTYGFDFTFGVRADPGVQLPFRRVTGPNIVWVDDARSPRYNTWADTDKEDAGANPEPMYVQPAYDLGAVIAYNASRTPGLGSAIFLHVSTGRATAGCVSLPAGQLTALLRWLAPGAAPVIAISAG
jgi:L,D-peptidoglycan transpeptidase YkuD (ErfK/YbiS/YcfS/YnhG family)